MSSSSPIQSSPLYTETILPPSELRPVRQCGIDPCCHAFANKFPFYCRSLIKAAIALENLGIHTSNVIAHHLLALGQFVKYQDDLYSFKQVYGNLVQYLYGLHDPALDEVVTDLYTQIATSEPVTKKAILNVSIKVYTRIQDHIKNHLLINSMMNINFDVSGQRMRVIPTHIQPRSTINSHATNNKELSDETARRLGNSFRELVDFYNKPAYLQTDTECMMLLNSIDKLHILETIGSIDSEHGSIAPFSDDDHKNDLKNMCDNMYGGIARVRNDTHKESTFETTYFQSPNFEEYQPTEKDIQYTLQHPCQRCAYQSNELTPFMKTKFESYSDEYFQYLYDQFKRKREYPWEIETMSKDRPFPAPFPVPLWQHISGLHIVHKNKQMSTTSHPYPVDEFELIEVKLLDEIRHTTHTLASYSQNMHGSFLYPQRTSTKTYIFIPICKPCPEYTSITLPMLEHKNKNGKWFPLWNSMIQLLTYVDMIKDNKVHSFDCVNPSMFEAGIYDSLADNPCRRVGNIASRTFLMFNMYSLMEANGYIKEYEEMIMIRGQACQRELHELTDPKESDRMYEFKYSSLHVPLTYQLFQWFNKWHLPIPCAFMIPYIGSSKRIRHNVRDRRVLQVDVFKPYGKHQSLNFCTRKLE